MYTLARLLLLASILCLCSLALLWPWLLIIPVVGLVRQKGSSLWGHGTARWCSHGEMSKAGMTQGNGVILGHVSERPRVMTAIGALLFSRDSRKACRDFLAAIRFMKPDQQLIRLPGKVPHFVCFAPSRSGKGASLIGPFLMTNTDSAFVMDPKLENAKLFAKHRRKMGHRVVVLDPDNILGDSDQLNPLDFIDKDSPHAMDDCKALAAAIVVQQPGGDRDPHWNMAARHFIGGIIAFVVCFCDKSIRNLSSVASILASPEKLQLAIERMSGSDLWEGQLAVWGDSLKHCKDKELNSVMSVTNNHLSFLHSPQVAKNVARSSFDPAGLRGKMTIFFGLSAIRMRTHAGLLRLWTTSVLQAVMRGPLGEKKLIHAIIDEAAGLGVQFEALNDLVDKGAGWGLRAQFYYQSQGQLKTAWPSDGGQTLLSNCAATYMALNDLQSAKEVSERLGDFTVALENTGRNSGTSATSGCHTSQSHSDGENRGWSQSKRRLLTPEEVMQLPQRTAITFIPSIPPVATTLVRWFETNLRPGWFRRGLTAVRVLLAALLVFGGSVLVALAVVQQGVSHEAFR